MEREIRFILSEELFEFANVYEGVKLRKLWHESKHVARIVYNRNLGLRPTVKAKCNAKRNASRPTLFCEKENRLKATAQKSDATKTLEPEGGGAGAAGLMRLVTAPASPARVQETSGSGPNGGNFFEVAERRRRPFDLAAAQTRSNNAGRLTRAQLQALNSRPVEILTVYIFVYR
ncbi:hypothetical protein EVAR_68066_1 [Eumeta japonica]|uniref:Uncharacterized protein n=1 Tax=Eumeta variegata TaxID=151549 RepID=A0A4C1ZTY5_EUMVA|nr:hypothetical protein EVAR_68066_1 [Eumeta japonica]